MPLPESIATIVHSAWREFDSNLESARIATGDWQADPLGEKLVRRAVGRCLCRLASTNLWGAENRLAAGEFWKLASPWLECGEMQLHARKKPLGYAGDFLMLDRIWRRYECQHPLGRLFDRFFQSRRAPVAVRNRILVAAREIERLVLGRTESKQALVVSVGSGPGHDLREGALFLPPERRTHLRFRLLDLDPKGLDFAAENLAGILPAENVECYRENLNRLATSERIAEHLRGADLILCTGLIDYLDDLSAASFIAALWQSLAPGGILLAFNFAAANSSRDYMEWIGDWRLIHRDVPAMRRLMAAAGIPDSCGRVVAEPLRANLLIRARKR